MRSSNRVMRRRSDGMTPVRPNGTGPTACRRTRLTFLTAHTRSASPAPLPFRLLTSTHACLARSPRVARVFTHSLGDGILKRRLVFLPALLAAAPWLAATTLAEETPTEEEPGVIEEVIVRAHPLAGEGLAQATDVMEADELERKAVDNIGATVGSEPGIHNSPFGGRGTLLRQPAPRHGCLRDRGSRARSGAGPQSSSNAHWRYRRTVPAGKLLLHELRGLHLPGRDGRGKSRLRRAPLRASRRDVRGLRGGRPREGRRVGHRTS